MLHFHKTNEFIGFDFFGGGGGGEGVSTYNFVFYVIDHRLNN